MVEKDESNPTTPTILIADDDPPTRILLRAAISKWGYETIEACNGKEAWDIFQQPNPPRLCIVDWLMPEMDGIELCTKVRKELSFHPYIILLTQISGTINIIRGLEAGADEFLSKPFKMAELRSRLNVGERIIQYENLVAQQNLEFSKLDPLIKQIDDIIKLFSSVTSDQTDDASKQIISKLHAVNEALKNLHPHNK